ncbi:MAG: hypothetical protein VYA18_06675, partial [Pseudomonadota bacterium]|nr:hypothetical protein [Pseudomonadota bacterium]
LRYSRPDIDSLDIESPWFQLPGSIHFQALKEGGLKFQMGQPGRTTGNVPSRFAGPRRLRHDTIDTNGKAKLKRSLRRNEVRPAALAEALIQSEIQCCFKTERVLLKVKPIETGSSCSWKKLSRR